MVVYLLWSSLHPDESMTQADVQTLQDEIACITPCMSQKQLLAAMVQLLSDGGGGGGEGITHVELVIRDAPSTPEPDPADTSHAWILQFRDGSPSLTWDPVALAWI